MVFQDINEAKEFLETYRDVDNFEIFGNTDYQYQFIADTYADNIDYKFSDICVISLDIETASEYGFPKVDNPEEEVLLITLRNLHTKETKTFGARKFDTSNIKHISNAERVYEYVYCKNEGDLLKRFLVYWQSINPDIITGWNSEFFDIPYLVARIERVLGEEYAKMLSPWKLYRQKQIENNGRTNNIFDLYGISHLDYMALYKKFVPNKEESYKLDYIAEKKLERKKLEHSYSSFKEFYTKDWQLFVEYNVVDVELVDALEDKLKFIEMVVNMAYFAKCNFQDIFFAVRTWDCILYNHLLKKNIIVPLKKDNEHDRKITGAYVKDPVVGLHKWVVCFDAASLYPSIILQYNMSPETLTDTVVDTNVEKLLQGERYESDVAVSALGYTYDKSSLGIFPEIVEVMFAERVKYKNMMLAAKREYEKNPTPQLKKDISKYDNYQQARKIQLNSLYGAWGNKYFRFFDHRIAESITITGQYIIRYVGKKLDEYLNKICGTKDEVFVIYMDTDSCYVSMDKVVQKYFPNLSVEDTVDKIDKICADKLTTITGKASFEIVQNTSAYKQAVNFKREVIASRGVWFKKKRYALNVYDNEGVRYSEPELKVMGVEIVRSDSPSGVKEYLKKSINIILNDDEDIMHKFINTVENEYSKADLNKISIPTSVNNLDKYSSPLSIYAKGAPMHVRASLLYNYHIKKKGLDKKYELIGEGDKVKYVILRTPNPIKENVIAYKTELPKELDLHRYIDYNSMLERTFIEPIIRFTEPLGWTPKPVATLDDLF